MEKQAFNSSQTSEILQEILGDDDSIDSFFRNIYQKRPKLYRKHKSHSHQPIENESSDLKQVLNMGCDGLAEICQTSRHLFSPTCPVSTIHPKNTSSTSITQNCFAISPPLIFKNKVSLNYDEIQTLYNSNPFAAYLDGCSLVQNHAQMLSPKFFNVCKNLQKSFPHVFTNTYLTPPQSQAVSAHADDRDVLVLQIMGKKHWKIYSQIPITHPYPEEQVGKYPHLPVPSSVLSSPLYLDTILNPGDVLYIPRGWVHEASTSSQIHHMSYHATLALATHDWTLGRIAAQEFQKCVESIPQSRLALPSILATSTPISSNYHECSTLKNKRVAYENLEKDLDDMFQTAKRHISAKFIASKYQYKIHHHNQHMEKLQKKILCHLYPPKTKTKTNSKHDNVGRCAASMIKLSSEIRASYPHERNSVQPTFDALGKPRKSGLSIANDQICDILLAVLAHVKQCSVISNDFKNEDIGGIEDTVDENENGQSQKKKQGSFIVSNLLQNLKVQDVTYSEKTQYCDAFSLLAFVKCCIEFGAMAIVNSTANAC